MDVQVTRDQMDADLAEHERWLAGAPDARAANFSGATLDGCRFTSASFAYVDLQNTSLRDADLSECQGLTLRQLAGADLTGAKLPDYLCESEARQQANDIAQICRTLYLVLVGACFYCWLTMATAPDVGLILNDRNTELPIVGVNIRITQFFVVAPFIL